ncbi:uncharacterized protein LOC136026140 isoform X2 [Artemia franciscana]|uniref:Uncharacterized protein n=1 Tax=Artemia franciscana TaxID=6661 RepID=A0AA88L3Q2_ARTSF|nr:hypothetical protein QYM36_012633 [Artemia franciscana]
MLIMRFSLSIMFASLLSSVSSTFSSLRIYPGNIPSERLSLYPGLTSKKSNLATKLRVHGRRSDIVPEIVPLKLSDSLPSQGLPNSNIKRVGLGSKVTYLKSRTPGTKINIERENDIKSNYIDDSKTSEYQVLEKNVNTNKISEKDDKFYTVESAKKTQKSKKQKTSTALSKLPNSPIFYIRLPPNPYNFVPGLGYIRTPSVDKNVLPVDFNANGRPSSLFSLRRPADDFLKPSATVLPPLSAETESDIETTTEFATTVTEPQPTTTTTTKPPKKVLTNSKITYIKGNFLFNGRPNAMFTVHSPYKPDYFQILHNFFYPGRKMPQKRS